MCRRQGKTKQQQNSSDVQSLSLFIRDCPGNLISELAGIRTFGLVTMFSFSSHASLAPLAQAITDHSGCCVDLGLIESRQKRAADTPARSYSAPTAVVLHCPKQIVA
jgi:hypothetical protein